MAKFKFTPPKGFTVPEHEGDKFDLVCTFEVEDDELCLVMLGDTPMPGYENKEKDKKEEGVLKESKPSYGDFASSMIGGMGGGGGGESAGGGY